MIATGIVVTVAVVAVVGGMVVSCVMSLATSRFVIVVSVVNVNVVVSVPSRLVDVNAVVIGVMLSVTRMVAVGIEMSTVTSMAVIVC